MVTIIDYKKRENENGQTFYALVLQGAAEFVRSTTSKKMYLTARRCTVFSTFDEAMCQSLIGTKYPGSIRKVPCDEYEFTIPESGEVIKLDFTYEYSEEAETAEEAVFERA